jgi:ribulose-5-phosphate 4-epimerase/fuculose-1-phosphate aldolase
MNSPIEDEKLLKDQSEISELPIDMIVNFRKPNVQFIRQPKQIAKHANELVGVFEKFRDSKQVKGLRCVSSRTGSGFMINTSFFELDNFNRDNVVEVVDFDPVRNNMMVIGNDPPAPEAALHWFIYRGFPDTYGIINVDNPEILNQFQQGAFPNIDLSNGILNLDLALKILQEVKNSNITLLSGMGVLVVGTTVNDAMDLFDENLKNYAKMSKDD